MLQEPLPHTCILEMVYFNFKRRLMLVTCSNGNEIGIHLFDNMNFKILSIQRCSISKLFLEQG